jgi:drug/metabolite transporter (DMT)-like permease
MWVMPKKTYNTDKLMKIPKCVVLIFEKFNCSDVGAIGNLYGALLILLATMIKVFSSTIVHSFPKKIPSMQILFVESAFAIFFICAFNIKSLKNMVKTEKLSLQIFKAICNTLGTICLFEGLKRFSLVVNSTLSLFSTFFSVLGAYIFFSETMNRSIAAALFFYFTGVIFLSKFDSQISPMFLFFPIVAAFLFSVSSLISKKIALFDSLKTSLFWVFFLQTLFTVGPSIIVWQYINLLNVFYIFIIAVSVFLALALALQAENFSALAFSAPFKSIRVLFSALIGMFFFGEKVSFILLVGIFCIIFSYIFLCKNCRKTTPYCVMKIGENILNK